MNPGIKLKKWSQGESIPPALNRKKDLRARPSRDKPAMPETSQSNPITSRQEHLLMRMQTRSILENPSDLSDSSRPTAQVQRAKSEQPLQINHATAMLMTPFKSPNQSGTAAAEKIKKEEAVPPPPANTMLKMTILARTIALRWMAIMTTMMNKIKMKNQEDRKSQGRGGN